MYLVYTAALGLGLLIALPYYAVRFRKYMPTLGERLGFVPPTSGPQPVWIHAVSVGELRAVDPLIAALRQRRPTRPILVSTTTPAGRNLAEGREDIERVTYFPLDLPGVVRRTLDRLRPELVIIAETEIWPNFLHQCKRRNVPVFMVNGRISDRSFRQYRRARRWLGRILDHYALLGMQSEGDAIRIRELGGPDEKVQVLGNLKYDGSSRHRQLDDSLQRALRSLQPLVVAASTARGEEQLLLEAFRALAGGRNGLTLLIAPRRAEHFDEVCRTVDASGLRWRRRSRLETGPADCDVLVLDSIGELNAVFEFASAVFMGGTLVARGGHNILEPARFGKPVLFGPHMDNFREMAREFLAAGAAVEVHTSDDLAARLAEVLDDPIVAGDMAAAGLRLIEKNRGATERALDAILSYPTPPPAQTSAPPVTG